MNTIQSSETITAIATAQGGAIGVIRLSGPAAIAITDQFFKPLSGPSLADRKGYSLVYGQTYQEDGEVLDDVLISLFRAPNSYTGEESIEISCHGSSYILQQTLARLIALGARMAQPGEFTQRAFLNGKMDLSQAEAVADLIASTSEATHRLAMQQMRGGYSDELKNLRDRLLHLCSLLELELDFGDHEELEFANRDELLELTHQLQQVLSGLVNSFKLGNAIKKGIPVAIIGPTNSGKSTLLNRLLHEEKAIVSNIHGTTRDVIEDVINIKGVPFRFIDTAGLRDTTDEIEKLGIHKSFEKLQQAEIILLMMDTTHPDENASYIKRAKELAEGKELIILRNKIDKLSDKETAEVTEAALAPNAPNTLFISAKSGLHIDTLEQKLVDLANLPNLAQQDLIVTNMRHYEALKEALEDIVRVEEGLNMSLSQDLISMDVRDCLRALSSILGDISTDEVLGNIFKHFCIGK